MTCSQMVNNGKRRRESNNGNKCGAIGTSVAAVKGQTAALYIVLFPRVRYYIKNTSKRR